MRLAILPIVTIFLATPAMAVEPSAIAPLVDTGGKTVGEARFSEGPHHVLIDVEVSGLPAGAHGIHLHAVGTCEDMSAWCEGCGWTLKETAEWRKLSPYRRRAVERELDRRMAKLGRTTDQHASTEP